LFIHCWHGHKIFSASVNLSLTKFMNDRTPQIYWGVNIAPWIQRLSIYIKKRTKYINLHFNHYINW
jgi:hypothetical protein